MEKSRRVRWPNHAVLWKSTRARVLSAEKFFSLIYKSLEISIEKDAYYLTIAYVYIYIVFLFFSSWFVFTLHLNFFIQVKDSHTMGFIIHWQPLNKESNN